MLLAATTDGLTILDDPCLKNPPSSLSHTHKLSSPPTAIAWSSDNSTLFIAAHNAIQKHDPSTGAFLKQVCVTEAPVSTLLTKDKGGATLVFASNSKVFMHSSGKISNTFDTHKSSTITSLSLSNDGTLLASTSASAAHVHNLALATPVHTVLRNLPPGNISTCAFHSHSRTRLLLGIGRHLVVCDTTRPSSPVKVVAMGQEREVLSISCSPFSKTLVAVACSGGTIGLVDLEKEKALFRILDMKVPLTALSFSADGASFYVGTENGKLLLQDLRGLDKPPTAVGLSENGCKVVALAVQKKMKITTTQARDASKVPAAATSTSVVEKPLAQQDATKPLAEARPSTNNVIKTASAPTATRKSSGSAPLARGITTRSKASPAKASGTMVKSAFSPTRSSTNVNNSSISDTGADISVQIETLTAVGRRSRPVQEKENLAAQRDDNVGKEESASSGAHSGAHPRSTLSVPAPGPVAGSGRLRSASTTSTHSAKSTTSASRAARSSASTSGAKAGLAAKTYTSASRSVSPAMPPSVGTRTPSPELPAPEPVTPLPLNRRKAAGMSVLGLGTPEVERWIEAGKGKGVERRGKKRVEFAEEEKGGENERREQKTEESDEDEDRPKERQHDKPENRLQISPRRPPGEQQTSSALQLSPLRFNSPVRHSASGSAGPSPLRSSSSAKDLMQNFMRDWMHEMQQDARAELRGLHLDVVRMSRVWRQDLKEGFDEMKAEMRGLREENQRLREENERLRRGY